MGKLKSLAGDVVKAGSNLWGDMKQGSYQIAEQLGYQKAGLSPKSNATRRAEAAAQPQVIPMPDEDALRQAQRRRFSAAATSGRASTVLTQQDDTLG